MPTDGVTSMWVQAPSRWQRVRVLDNERTRAAGFAGKLLWVVAAPPARRASYGYLGHVRKTPQYSLVYQGDDGLVPAEDVVPLQQFTTDRSQGGDDAD